MPIRGLGFRPLDAARGGGPRSGKAHPPINKKRGERVLLTLRTGEAFVAIRDMLEGVVRLPSL